jgi:hypothetical protein
LVRYIYIDYATDQGRLFNPKTYINRSKVVQGTGLVDRQTGASIDIYDSVMKPNYGKDAKEYADQINELITVEMVPTGQTKYDQVLVNPKAAELKK